MTLRCRICSAAEVASRTLDDLVFSSLEVLTCEEATERSFSNLQEAVDDWFAPDLKPDTFQWQCGKCHAQQPLECRNSPESPPVLVIRLKQRVYTWKSRKATHRNPGVPVTGDWIPQRRDNDLLLNDIIR